MPDDQPGAATRREPAVTLRRDAAFQPSTFNREARTVEVIFTTGADVLRRDYWTGESWVERLRVTEDAVNLTRLNAGAPVLNSHQSNDLSNVVGVVERAWIANGQGRALLRFSDRPEVAGIVADVEAGILRNISAGYWVEQWNVTEGKGTPTVKEATRWTPGELSLVPVPADAGAQVRAADTASTRDRDAAQTQEVRMPDEVNPGSTTPAPAQIETRAAPQPAAPAPATLEQLQGLASRAGVDADWIVRQLAAKVTVDAARDALIDEMAARRAPVQSATVQVLRDDKDTFLARAADGLAVRLSNAAPNADQREFTRLGLHGLIREIAIRSGERNAHRMTSEDLADFALRSHSTSDFATVLANSTNKTVRDMYGAYANTWSSWVQEVDVADFKTITAGFLGMYPDLPVIPEGGPVRMGTIAEEGETYAVQERGRRVQLTRQAIINDDTRAFSRVIGSAALAGYNSLRSAIFGILTTNANMADGVALFATATGARLQTNLGTAGALNSTTLTELMTLLMQMRSPVRAGSGETGAPLPPPTSLALLVSPAEYRSALELTSALIQPTVIGAAMPVEMRNMIEVVMDPTLNTGAQPYYLARKDIRAIEVAYLNGRRAPEVTSAEDVGHTGVDFRVLFDFGAKAVTHRTIAGNLG